MSETAAVFDFKTIGERLAANTGATSIQKISRTYGAWFTKGHWKNPDVDPPPKDGTAFHGVHVHPDGNYSAEGAVIMKWDMIQKTFIRNSTGMPYQFEAWRIS